MVWVVRIWDSLARRVVGKILGGGFYVGGEGVVYGWRVIFFRFLK